MKHSHPKGSACCCCRRHFLQAAGAAGTLAWLSSSSTAAEPAEKPPARSKAVPTVRGAFVYPPSETLRQAGYWSWPGSSFDPEGHQKEYLGKIRQIEQDLGMQILMDEKPLDQEASVTAFINQVKQSKPDGLLLIPFKKGHWPHVVRIVEETKIPAVALVTLGVLLVGHINQLHRRPGVYLINSMDDFRALARGMKMIRTARRMKDARLLNITGSEVREANVPVLGTQVRTIPLQRFYEEYARMEAGSDVKEVARAYGENAKEVVEPSQEDILDAAKACFVLKKLVEAEQADAVMMNCLPGLRKPHKHPPPCMGFMTLRDEGIPAGCQSDLSSTLTLMLVQELFDRPGFQQNASMATEDNHFFGAHCTSPSKMSGPEGPAEPYILRSHAEAGWGCVPQVLFPARQDVTMAQYVPEETPRMLIYTGQVARCYPKAPGGCRTNIEMTINEVDDVCDVQGMHQIIFYGNFGRQLRAFCQLFGIEAVS